MHCMRCGFQMECPKCGPLYEEPEPGAREPVSVEELELSVRAWNCIHDAGIKTIGELVQFGPIELLQLKNFGEVSLREIVKLLAQRGERLREPDSHEGGSAWRRIWRNVKQDLYGEQT